MFHDDVIGTNGEAMVNVFVLTGQFILTLTRLTDKGGRRSLMEELQFRGKVTVLNSKSNSIQPI